jgi:hypothetical protein
MVMNGIPAILLEDLLNLIDFVAESIFHFQFDHMKLFSNVHGKIGCKFHLLN